MKLVDIKELDAYLYAQAVLPLKELVVDSWSDVPSPLQSRTGETTIVFAKTEDVDLSSCRRNFQRDAARKKARKEIYIKANGRSGKIGTYDRHTKTVELYEEIAREFYFGMAILRNLEKQYNGSYPFKNVRVVSGPTPQPRIQLADLPF